MPTNPLHPRAKRPSFGPAQEQIGIHTKKKVKKQACRRMTRSCTFYHTSPTAHQKASLDWMSRVAFVAAVEGGHFVSVSGFVKTLRASRWEEKIMGGGMRRALRGIMRVELRRSRVIDARVCPANRSAGSVSERPFHFITCEGPCVSESTPIG